MESDQILLVSYKLPHPVSDLKIMFMLNIAYLLSFILFYSLEKVLPVSAKAGLESSRGLEITHR